MDPNHLVLRPRKMRSGQRFSYLALEPEETRALNAGYHQRIHHGPHGSDRAPAGRDLFQRQVQLAKKETPLPRLIRRPASPIFCHNCVGSNLSGEHGRSRLWPGAPCLRDHNLLRPGLDDS
jgi:hypothetical protein